MRIGFLIFDGVTALDVFGPLDILSRVKTWKIELVCCKDGPVNIGNQLSIMPQSVLTEKSLFDVFVIPGGPGQVDFCYRSENLDIIKSVAQKATYILSICTGSLILAMSGVLQNKRATTHRSALGALKKLGVTVESSRIVEDGKILSCGGVSAGIDIALYFVNMVAGRQEAQKIQMNIEYDPLPLFDFKVLLKDRSLVDTIDSEKTGITSRRNAQIEKFLLEKAKDR